MITGELAPQTWKATRKMKWKGGANDTAMQPAHRQSNVLQTQTSVETFRTSNQLQYKL